MQFAQGRSRIGSQFLAERAAKPLKHNQRLGRAACRAQRPHAQGMQALAQRVSGSQFPQFGGDVTSLDRQADQAGIGLASQEHLRPVLGSTQPQVIQATGITVAALIPALALPATRHGGRPRSPEPRSSAIARPAACPWS